MTYPVPDWASAPKIVRMCPIPLLALMFLACGPPPVEPPTRVDDGGPGVAMDGGPSFADGAAAEPDADTPDFHADARCFDGALDDEGLPDCAADRCASFGPCCVGVADAACCWAGETKAISFASCDETEPIANCLTEGFEVFGTEVPLLEGGGLVPNGLIEADTGIVLLEATSPARERLALSAELVTPFDCAEPCVATVGIGFGPRPEPDTQWIADVALVASSGRRELVLLVLGEVVERWSLVETEARRVYRLSTRPDGTARVDVDGEVLAGEVPIPLRNHAHAVLLGRTSNRPPDVEAPRALSLTLERAHCDMPRALERVAAIDTSAIEGEVRSSTAWSDAEGRARVVLEVEGALVAARLESGVLIEPAPLLAPGAVDAFALRSPASVVDTGGRRWIFFATHDQTGPVGIAAIPIGDEGAALDEAIGLALPEGHRLTDPAPYFDSDEARPWQLVALGSEGFVRLAAETIDGDFDWVGEAEVFFGPRSEDAQAFDRDEVAAPHLWRDAGGVLRLFYAGRRGSRWSIGLAIAHRLDFVERFGDTALLSGSGVGVDALGARAPAILDHGDSGYTLLYSGLDGAAERLTAARGRGR